MHLYRYRLISNGNGYYLQKRLCWPLPWVHVRYIWRGFTKEEAIIEAQFIIDNCESSKIIKYFN